MRAAMWLIDRWRASDAYARMTAEEQGLYRNLCDELFLRESGVIPDDPRILAKASGDHEAWARCGKSVLKSMKKVAGGWTNETALAVKKESERRSRKQRDYRNGLGNADGNGTDNETPPQDLDQEMDTGNGKNGVSTRAQAVSIHDACNIVTRHHPDVPTEDRLNEDFEFAESRLRTLLVGIRDSGKDIQAVLDSLPIKRDRSPFSAYTWERSGRSGINCSAGGLTVLRLTNDALEAWKRGQDQPIISENNKRTFDALDRVTARMIAKRDGTPLPKELEG